MESEDGRRALPPTLVPSLNALLASLSLPFTLEIPTDLTPSLLLAVLESIIEARLPIPNSVRASRTREAKIRAMLILLGVLECDVLRGGINESELLDGEDDAQGVNVSVVGWTADIGLGEVDPERLADGGWDETVFVGELLCWLARRRGFLPSLSESQCHSHHSQSYADDDPSEDFTTSLLLHPSSPNHTADMSTLSHITDVPRHPLVHSPEPSTAGTTTTDLSMRAKSISSQTSISGSLLLEDESTMSDDTAHPYFQHGNRSNDDPPPVFRPRCIHELDDPSFIQALAGPSTPRQQQRSPGHENIRPDDTQYADLRSGVDDPPEPPTPTPRRVRLTGWINEVDGRAELKQFAASRIRSGSRTMSSLEPRLTSGLGSKFESRKPSGSVKPCTKTSSLTPTTIASGGEVLTMRTGTTVPTPDDYNDDPNDPQFNVSFSTLLNTSTPVKPKSRAHERQPLRISRQLNPLYTHSECRTSSQASLQIPGGRHPSHDRSSSLPLVPSENSQVHITTRRDLDTAPAHTSHLSTFHSSHRSSNLRNSSVPSAGTTATVSLLNERARLLTELVALKRARAVSRGNIVDG